MNDQKNIIEHWEESEQSEALMNKLGFFQIQLWGWGADTKLL